MADQRIEILDTGLIYRNPKPHVRSIHAYSPSVVRMDNGELLCTLVAGEAIEAANCHTFVTRSADEGKTWRLESRLTENTENRLTSDATRLTALPDGEVLAFMVPADRTQHPNDGLNNPNTLGSVPTELLLLRSHDFGHTWRAPELIVPPLQGPEFELCSPVVPLKTGRWLLPTSTWHAWNGLIPGWMKMVALISDNQGRNWHDYAVVMDDPNQEVIYWESKIAELPDGRLLAVAWAYDHMHGEDLPCHYALNQDGGKNWFAPSLNKLQAQALAPLVLADGTILSVYRRMDAPGLWASLSHLEGFKWVNDAQEPLWGAQGQSLTSDTSNPVERFQALKFGAPSLLGLPDGTVFLAFWCYEEHVSNIRWFKLRILG